MQQSINLAVYALFFFLEYGFRALYVKLVYHFTFPILWNNLNSTIIIKYEDLSNMQDP